MLKDPLTNLHRINLKEKAKNAEFDYWGTYIPVKNLQIGATVIHGKGIGKKQIGLPTANLQISEHMHG